MPFAMDVSPFKGLLGILRMLSLFAGLVVFVLLLADQFYAVANIKLAPSLDAALPSWFSLFGYTTVIFYLTQTAWTLILVLAGGLTPAPDKSAMKKIDSGLNGGIGVMVFLISVWWIVLYLYSAWENLGEEHYCSGRNPAGCVQKHRMGLALAAWFFAAAHGILSTIVGVFLFMGIQKEEGGPFQVQFGQGAPPNTAVVAPSSTTQNESFRTAPA